MRQYLYKRVGCNSALCKKAYCKNDICKKEYVQSYWNISDMVSSKKVAANTQDHSKYFREIVLLWNAYVAHQIQYLSNLDYSNQKCTIYVLVCLIYSSRSSQSERLTLRKFGFITLGKTKRILFGTI